MKWYFTLHVTRRDGITMLKTKHLLAILMIFALLGANPSAALTAEDNTQNTQARQTDLVADACEGITFEDMFEYSYAKFEVDIDPSYETAFVKAEAYINGTLSDTVRTDLDDLIGETGAPGGGNGYLSSQERDAIEEIAKDCIVVTNPRFGFRTGLPHRGGDGVDWKNASWVKDDNNPMQLEYWNLFPSNHPENRTCPPGSAMNPTADCYEIPTTVADPNGQRDCDTSGMTGPDECRIIVWLNGTMTWSADLTAADSFTIAMNTTNMTNAELEMTFPSKNSNDGDPLRLAMFEECDGRNVLEGVANQGDTPPVGGCQNDGTITNEPTSNSDGSLTVFVHTTYDLTQWPNGQDMFGDFTNQPPPPNDPPQWTDDAPADSSHISVPSAANTEFMSVVDQGLWLTDEAGFSAIDLQCSSSTWPISEDANGSWWVTTQESGQGTVSCTPFDEDDNGTVRAGETRTFNLLVPFTMATNSEITSPHLFTLTPSSSSPTMDVTVTLFQENAIATGTGSLSGSVTDISVDTGSLSPGDIHVRVMATASGMTDFVHTYDIVLTKDSLPPTITVSSAEWDGSQWQVSGTFSDPDGEDVTFTIEIDGQNGGQITTSGNMWSSESINFEIWGEGVFTVTVNACDVSNECTTITETVDTSFLFDDQTITPPAIVPSETTESEGLPAPGIAFTVLSIIGALMYTKRRE